MNNSPDRVLTEKGESLPGCGAGSGRIKFVDTAKGICILLVVMYHAGVVDNDTPLFKYAENAVLFYIVRPVL